MKLVFAGTPDFARVALQALHEAGHEIALVLTQPDRPAGRGMKLQASAVKQYALAHGLAVAQPLGLKLDGRHPQDAANTRDLLLHAQADVMVVAAYGLILPAWTLTLPRLGCLNIHASLLPRWRGAAPIHRAIEAGDSETGVTLMQMDAGLDTGAMLMVARTPIGATETTGQLHDRLATLGAEMMVRLLTQPTPWPAVPQPADGICYAHKIDKAESWLDWQQDAEVLASKLRAFDPFPGGAAVLEGVSLKVWAANAQSCGVAALPGTVLGVSEDGIDVACGTGRLRLTELQRPGGKRLACADFLRGHPVRLGSVFETELPS